MGYNAYYLGIEVMIVPTVVVILGILVVCAAGYGGCRLAGAYLRKSEYRLVSDDGENWTLRNPNDQIVEADGNEIYRRILGVMPEVAGEIWKGKLDADRIQPGAAVEYSIKLNQRLVQAIGGI